MIVSDPELGDAKDGLTCMWRHCCLQKVADAFAIKQEKDSMIVVDKYHCCLTQDDGNMTIAGPKRSMIRRGELMDSQFYMNHKRLYEAAMNFPWNDGDDTMAVMIRDSHEASVLMTRLTSLATRHEASE